LHDVLGLYPRFVPKFAKQYADLASTIKKAVGEYASDVRHGTFPEEKHVFKMDDAERDKLDLRQKS
jgi:3-methyl-2-oxobutanoate hydroxymethyltransferase